MHKLVRIRKLYSISRTNLTNLPRKALVSFVPCLGAAIRWEVFITKSYKSRKKVFREH